MYSSCVPLATFASNYFVHPSHPLHVKTCQIYELYYSLAELSLYYGLVVAIPIPYWPPRFGDGFTGLYFPGLCNQSPPVKPPLH